MKNLYTLSLLSILFLLLPASVLAFDSDQEEFFEKLKLFCGSSFAGEVVYPETPPQGFTDPLVAHFTVCEENEVHIPFHVGSNESRTWILTMEEGGLLFKHDHRHPDGTPENMTNYGGWASDEGDHFKQRFPADDHTISLRDNLRSHIWKIELSEDLTTYSYSLYLYDDLYFRADFDMTKSL